MKKVLIAASFIMTTSLAQASEQWHYLTEDVSSPDKSKHLSVETKEMHLTIYRSKYASQVNSHESSGAINQNDNISDIIFHNYKYDCKGNLAVSMKTEVRSKDSKGYMEVNSQLVKVKERQITSKGTRYCQNMLLQQKRMPIYMTY